MDYRSDFLDYLKFHRSLAENTIKSYEWDLKIFFQWADQRGFRPEEAKPKDIDAFIIWTRKNGSSIQTANRKASCLKTFYRWLLRIEVIERNPLDLFENIKGPRHLPRYLTKEQQELLLKTAKKGNGEIPWMDGRNYLVVLLLIDSGLRISELCSLQMKDVNLKEGILRILGKGGKEREVVLSDRVRRAIGKFLAMIEKIRFDGATGPGLASRGLTLKGVSKQLGVSYGWAYQTVHGKSKKGLRKINTFMKKNINELPIPFLFFNKHGKRLGSRHAFRIIQELGKKSEIENLYPHMLRHTFASNIRQRGGDLLLMREALGHSSVNTTQIYAHIGNEQYKSQLRNLINQN